MSKKRSLYELLSLPREELSTHVTCLICGYDFRSLGSHLRSAHQTNSKEYIEEFDAEVISEELRVELALKRLGQSHGFCFKTFEDARQYARNLKLKNSAMWYVFTGLPLMETNFY